jgi:hypothetical protein
LDPKIVYLPEYTLKVDQPDPWLNWSEEKFDSYLTRVKILAEDLTSLVLKIAQKYQFKSLTSILAMKLSREQLENNTTQFDH